MEIRARPKQVFFSCKKQREEGGRNNACVSRKISNDQRCEQDFIW